MGLGEIKTYRRKKCKRIIGGATYHVWRREEVYAGFWLGKPEGKRPFGRSRSRWEDNIKMDLQEVGWTGWTGLIWLRIGTGGRHL
jgi:hypothetical protein